MLRTYTILENAKKHLLLAKKNKTQNDSASERINYAEALRYLAQITDSDDPDYYFLKGYCHYNLANYLQAYCSYKIANKLSISNKKASEEELSSSLDFMLNEKEFADCENILIASSTSHKFHYFFESFMKHTSRGVTPGYEIISYAASNHSHPVVDVLGLVLLVTGTSLGLLSGSIHGFFRAVSRHPLSKEELCKMVCSLDMLNSQSKENKKIILNKILKAYAEKLSISRSDSSEELFAFLNREEAEIGVNEKWSKLSAYLLNHDKDGYFCNNGKKLFLVAHQVFQEYFNELRNQNMSQAPDSLYCHTR